MLIGWLHFRAHVPLEMPSNLWMELLDVELELVATASALVAFRDDVPYASVVLGA